MIIRVIKNNFGSYGFSGFAFFFLQGRTFSLLKKAAHSQNVRCW